MIALMQVKQPWRICINLTGTKTQQIMNRKHISWDILFVQSIFALHIITWFQGPVMAWMDQTCLELIRYHCVQVSYVVTKNEWNIFKAPRRIHKTCFYFLIPFIVNLLFLHILYLIFIIHMLETDWKGKDHTKQSLKHFEHVLHINYYAHKFNCFVLLKSLGLVLVYVTQMHQVYFIVGSVNPWRLWVKKIT